MINIIDFLDFTLNLPGSDRVSCQVSVFRCQDYEIDDVVTYLILFSVI